MKITQELRAYIETRYALGRSYAELAEGLNDKVIGKKYGVGRVTVYRIARRGFTALKCNDSKKEIPVDIINAIEVDVRKRLNFEMLWEKDSARAISLDTGIKIERVRAIGTYGLSKKKAPKRAEKVDYVRRFLTAPVVSFGICEGYY